MPKSSTFKTLEKCVTDIQAAQKTYIASGKRETLSISVETAIRKFKATLNKNDRVLLECNETGNILMLVISAFSSDEYSEILKLLLDDMFRRIREFSTDDQLIIYTAKVKGGLNPFKLSATKNLYVSVLILREICELEEPSRIPEILTGTVIEDNETVTAYTRGAIEYLKSGMTELTREQRGILFTERDASDDACNVIAYAAQIKDSEFIKLILHFAHDASAIDPTFLADPTGSSQVNANIFLYILSQLNLVMQLQRLQDLPTLKKMLTTRGDGGLNAVAVALKTPKLLAALLSLVQRLAVVDQKVVLNQLTIDAKQKLAQVEDCPEEIKALLEITLPQALKLFKPAADSPADADSAASATNTLQEDKPDPNSAEFRTEDSSTLR